MSLHGETFWEFTRQIEEEKLMLVIKTPIIDYLKFNNLFLNF